MTEPDAVRGHRRTAGWTRVSHGLHRRDTVSDLDAWQLVLPAAGRFTHLTAAAELGWWLPARPEWLPVFAAVPTGSTRPARAGLHVVRTDAARSPQVHGGLRLDAPTEVLLACARDLELLDLCMLTDSALHRGHCSRDEVAETAAGRRRGCRRLRAMLDLCDPRTESPWETVLRLLHVVCDVEVEPQHEIRSTAGDFVARADLLLTGTRTIHEYDGEVHLSREQQRADLERCRRLAAAGVVRRGYTSYDLLRRPITVLRDADLTLGRRHDPARVREWHRLLSDSLLTPSGQHRLRVRLAAPRRTTRDS